MRSQVNAVPPLDHADGSSLDRTSVTCGTCGRPVGRRASRTHVLHDLATLERHRATAGLAALRELDPSAATPCVRRATTTHVLRDLASIFSSGDVLEHGPRRIRVCVIDTMLQTGGAEWFSAQLAMASNPAVFEFVFVTYNSRHSQIAHQLAERGIRVFSASDLRHGSLKYSEWLEAELFDVLDRLSPDLLFLPAQYLFDQLDKDRLAAFSVGVRISNFHGDGLAATDFSSAAKVICCTDEQHEAVRRAWPDKAVLINTGVDTELFRDATPAKKDELKRTIGVAGKQVVLFVGRLGSPLKRLDVFQDVVRRINAERSDVAFVVAGYFSSRARADENDFRRFVEDEGLVWRTGVPPWEMPALFEMADFLLSTSAEHEGLSNTVLQALAAGVVPVTTASAGMHELIEEGDTGYLVQDFGVGAIAEALSDALNSNAATRAQLRQKGRSKAEGRFSFRACATDYQREFLDCYRSQPARVCITDGSFGTGGAEWLAALLILNSDPPDTGFELALYRLGSPLSSWLADRGVAVRAAPPGLSYKAWRDEGMATTFQSVRPHVVMPCTIMSWPRHKPFYRLLAISQNAADARKLTPAEYERADHFLCVSQEVMDHLDPGYRWKMSVLHNSVDVDMFSPNSTSRREVREHLGIAQDARVVLWAGRMHERHKRLDVLMDVIDNTADDALHYLVIGYFGTDQHEARAAWREFLESHPKVSWVADAAPWEMPRYYSAADIYLSTSGFERADFEGLSLTSVQALAAELPVVTTISGGQQEVVEDGINGRLVPHGDVARLSVALREMASLTDSRLRELRAANRAKALERFDIREHARLYARIARLLKNNVGAALTADSELPAGSYDFSDAELSPSNDVHRASSFLRYTWPLIASADPTGDRTVVERVESPIDLETLADSLQPGAQVTLVDIGPSEADTVAGRHSVARITALLDHLASSFPKWSACERDGTDLVFRR